MTQHVIIGPSHSENTSPEHNCPGPVHYCGSHRLGGADRYRVRLIYPPDSVSGLSWHDSSPYAHRSSQSS